jgi:signal transduction histidine kinase
MVPWAEMLSRIGHRNSQLYDFLTHGFDRRTTGSNEDHNLSAGAVIIQELERERSRIARDLHAGAGQPLAGIKLNLEMLDSCAGSLPAAGRAALTRVQNLADQALEQVRAVSHKLHPPDWQALTTAEAIQRLVRSSGLADRVQLRLELGPLPLEPSHAVKIALYRCAQECISNVARHSGATELGIRLTENAGKIELQVEDNGRGIPSGGSPTGGIGLRAMREHAAALGGTCEVTSVPQGLTVVVRLPLEED